MPPRKKTASKAKATSQKTPEKILVDQKIETISDSVAQIQNHAGYSSSNASGPSDDSIVTLDEIRRTSLTQLATKFWSTPSSSFNVNVIKHIFQEHLDSANPTGRQYLEQSGYFENYLLYHYSATSSFEHTLSIVFTLNEKHSASSASPIREMTKYPEKCALFFQALASLAVNAQHLLVDAQHWLAYITFYITVFQNMENVHIRNNTLRYLSLPIWENLSKTRLTSELENSSLLQKHWKAFQTQKQRSSNKAAPAVKGGSSGGKRKREGDEESARAVVDAQMQLDQEWIFRVIEKFMDSSTKLSGSGDVDIQVLRFVERCAEFFVELLSQVSTRRYLKALLDDNHVVVKARRTPFVASGRPDSGVVAALLASIDSYIHFDVDDQSGNMLTVQDCMERTNTKLQKLQQTAFVHFNMDLKDLIFSSMGELAKPSRLRQHLSLLEADQLVDLALKLKVLSEKDVSKGGAHDTEFVMDLMCEEFCARPRILERLNSLFLYPTEELLWDSAQLPLSGDFSSAVSLALPKLNLQFLSIQDYLMRNFTLFRLESAFEIRSDLTDAIKRLGPKEGTRGSVAFGGWARMAMPVVAVSVDEVSRPRLGETLPARVTSSITVDLSRFSGDIRAEWEALREHDVVFLVCIEHPQAGAAQSLSEFEKERQEMKDFEWKEEGFDFPKTFGVKYVRGAEIFEVRDEENVILNDPFRPDERPGKKRVGNKRKLRVQLDPAQYQDDISAGRQCYESFNVVVRRNPKENNFKAVLETIRSLMNTAAVGRAIPSWLYDIFLGRGDPSAANFRSEILTITQSGGAHVEDFDYLDTFLDAQHVTESFPDVDSVAFVDVDGTTTTSCENLPPPFRLKITTEASSASDASIVGKGTSKVSKKSTAAAPSGAAAASTTVTRVVASTYRSELHGPYPQDKTPSNSVRFTPTQVEAIRSGLHTGLTMIVGPPGTGKTDVAVQIIANLYHNNPTQKILVVTHSNAALNDLFEKIMERNVAARHLLRLGSGEVELQESLAAGGALGSGRGQGEAFSKHGRVQWSLARRLQLLGLVQRLAVSLGIPGDVGATCETAGYFKLQHIQSRMNKFHTDVKNMGEKRSKFNIGIDKLFPFTLYFSDAPQPLFTGEWVSDVEVAESCFEHINGIFKELADYRAFELLRTHNMRSDFLLTKQARIVAMTCTHAAMTRQKLVQLGFQYDSIIMEEAGQILEVETLIPMLLQDVDSVTGSRLKRVVLLGDHHQLPPVVKHSVLQKYCKLDQSLFTRFIRMGVPYIQLDKQGRARPEIALLYSWRYADMKATNGDSLPRELGNLPVVVSKPEFRHANAGFRHCVQLVDVPDFDGRGESCPTPHFYQNLGEAEYVVAVFQYMCLIGYPASKISILTTYNGQKNLIRDVLAQRCRHPAFGRPGSVSTVDKYQGQQNDYILLSLVRTSSVGHLRDVRRLVVALSRARLGLYVFCRKSLFMGCFECLPAFSRLLAAGDSDSESESLLELVAGEGYPSERAVDAGANTEQGQVVHRVEGVTAMGVLVFQMVQQAELSRSLVPNPNDNSSSGAIVVD